MLYKKQFEKHTKMVYNIMENNTNDYFRPWLPMDHDWGGRPDD
jgi:hypothetical protein